MSPVPVYERPKFSPHKKRIVLMIVMLIVSSILSVLFWRWML